MKSHQKLKYFKKAKSFEESNSSPIKRKAKKTISEPRKYAFKNFSSLRIKSVKKSVKSRISFRVPTRSADLVKKIRNGFKSHFFSRRSTTKAPNKKMKISYRISLVENEDDFLEDQHNRRSNWRKLSQEAQERFYFDTASVMYIL